MPYDYAETTSYISHESTGEVAEAIVTLCAMEGMRCVPRPNTPPNHGRALANNIWGVAVYPGGRSREVQCRWPWDRR
jgi:hypothetical protein